MARSQGVVLDEFFRKNPCEEPNCNSIHGGAVAAGFLKRCLTDLSPIFEQTTVGMLSRDTPAAWMARAVYILPLTLQVNGFVFGSPLSS